MSRTPFIYWLLLLLSLALTPLLLQSSLPSDKPRQVQIAEQYLFVRETNGYNRSPEIDSMNQNCRNPPGASYCAAAVYWCLDKAGVYYPNKKSGLARSLRNNNTFTAWDVLNKKKNIKAGDAIIWQKGKTINGHAALADEDWPGSSGKTIEANTSPGGSGNQADGDGFFIKKRRIEPFNYFRIKWITPFY